ncbi:hypothetical protein [Shewanella woodyi]|nr:hypothetical protein [Shewanella woodyi]
MKKIKNFTLLFFLSLCLISCGGSDNDESKPDVTYIQYYNASPDSTSTYLSLTKKKYSKVNFGYANSRVAVTTGSNKLTIVGTDAKNKEVKFHQKDIDFEAQSYHLFVLTGKYADSGFLDLKYSQDKLIKENEENKEKKITKMQVIAAHVSQGVQDFDIYVGKKEDGFSSAKYLGKLKYLGVSSPEILVNGKYVVYLAKAGGNEPIFTTKEIDLKLQTTYKLMIRPGFGQSKYGVKLDVVSSSKTVSSYPDINESVQFRVYDGFEHSAQLQVMLKGKDGEEKKQDVTRWQVSAFTPTKFGDYDVSVSDPVTGEQLLDNLLVTYNQSDSKTILFYPTKEKKLKASVIEHNLTPRSYEYQAKLVNLATDKNGLEVYFVRNNETVETAKHFIKKWNFLKTKSLTLPRDKYTVTLVEKKTDGTLNLLHRQTLELKDNLDYTLVLTPDASEQWGYRLTAFQ